MSKTDRVSFVVIPALQLEFKPWKLWVEIDRPTRLKDCFVKGDHEWHILFVDPHEVAVYNPRSTGIAAAAAAAESAKNIFVNSVCTFMVGIAGMVPEILPAARLGDVIWATSLVQHDWGKVLGEDVHVTRVSKSFSPPFETGQKHTDDAAREFSQKRELVQSLAGALPSLEHDLLFPSVRICPQFEENPDEPERCRCDQNVPGVSLRQRAVLDSKIWSGVCGCGSQVVKSAPFRRYLGREGVSHCEMELAGVAVSGNWFSVRGLCDYADSHKRKEFQSLSAANAVVFTICLLRAIPRISSGLKKPDEVQLKQNSQTALGNNNIQAQGDGLFAQRSNFVLQKK